MSDNPTPQTAPVQNPSLARNRRGFIRRRPRGRLKVACYKGALDLGENVALGVADVSESGVRLLIKTELPRGQEVTLQLEGRDHQKPIKVKGKIIWSLAQEGGNFQIGVQLDSYFLYKDILKMT